MISSSYPRRTGCSDSHLLYGDFPNIPHEGPFCSPSQHLILASPEDYATDEQLSAKALESVCLGSNTQQSLTLGKIILRLQFPHM